MRTVSKDSNVINFRKHPMGFFIIQNNDDKFGKDDDHVFFNSFKLLSCQKLEELQGKIEPKKLREINRNAKKAYKILDELYLKSEALLVNPRYGDCYFKLFDYYIKLYKTNDNIASAKPFGTFVLNSCLFGAYFCGRLLNGDIVPLVDHRLQLKSSIVDIVVNNDFHIYEKTIFINFYNHLSQLKKLSTTNLIIYYHLPTLDYILSMLLLWIKKEMTIAAFIKSVHAIQLRGKIHKDKLGIIAAKFGVNVTFLSPFQNLFNPNHEIHGKLLVLMFRQVLSESKLVKSIILLLKANSHFPEMGQIWRKLDKIFLDSCTTLNELLGYANASVIAYAKLKNSSESRVGVWLPSEEYPVYNNYQKNMSSLFGDVTAFCYLSPFLNYVDMQPNGSHQQSLFRYKRELQDPFKEEGLDIPVNYSWLNLQQLFINSPSARDLFSTVKMLRRCAPFFAKFYDEEQLCKIQIVKGDFKFSFVKRLRSFELLVTKKNHSESDRYFMFFTDKNPAAAPSQTKRFSP